MKSVLVARKDRKQLFSPRQRTERVQEFSLDDDFEYHIISFIFTNNSIFRCLQTFSDIVRHPSWAFSSFATDFVQRLVKKKNNPFICPLRDAVEKATWNARTDRALVEL